MPLVRWLLPLVAALAFVGSSVTAWAAAGMIGESECCCPVKAKCKCHDHDKTPAPSAEIKRCNGEAELVVPAIPAGLLAVAFTVPVPTRIQAPRVVMRVPIPDDRTLEPETPPF